MTLAIVLRVLVSLLGLAAFAAFVGVAGPLLDVAGTRPLEEETPRWLLIGAVTALVLGLLVFDVLRRVQRARQLERGVAEGSEGDGQALRTRMTDALATLRKAGGAGANSLYDLPWYVIIGPPGSGKTTALVNSGLRFPLADGGTRPGSVAGVGGTRYCDWWFTDGAVLIDTAGRYTTQDSDGKADRRSWLAFLDLLKRNRPRQPINGVLIAISIEDVLTLPPRETSAHVRAIRERLAELQERLGIGFPVYFLFTKMDLVAGFMPFFSHLNEAARRGVWGTTFAPPDKRRNMVSELGPRLDALVARLAAEVPYRLQEETSPSTRLQAFGFPAQIEALKAPIMSFVARIFDPKAPDSPVALRGVYFTSGTQEGTPIDQLIGSLSARLRTGTAPAPLSGGGKSFFLSDLLTEVVMGEAGWVSNDPRAERWRAVLRGAAFAALALALAGAGTAWWLSYGRNVDLIAATNEQTKTFTSVAAPVIQEPTIVDRDLARVSPILDRLRFLPAGAGREPPPAWESYAGLSQWGRIGAASEAFYRTGLDRILRPRLLYRLEELADSAQTRPEAVPRLASVYAMVAGREAIDEAKVMGWLHEDLETKLYPGEAQQRVRAAVAAHVQAMLALSGGEGAGISLSESLLQRAPPATAPGK